MLVSLSIKNFALIESLSVDFSDGLQIITGETGAGKSILLGALGLVLGKRADVNSLKNKDVKCTIEAHFNLSKYELKKFFDEYDLDFDANTIIRREILPNGKSRAFVNDTPTNLNELVLLGNHLIDIHSQHQTLELSEEAFQIEILDAIAQNQNLLFDYQSSLKEYKFLNQQIESKQLQWQDLKKESDYNQFLLQELEDAKLVSEEQKLLEEEFEVLNNIELIKEQFDKTLGLSNHESIGTILQLLEMKNALQKISNFSDQYNVLFERMQSVFIEFKDILNEIEITADGMISDASRLDFLQNKLQTIYNLLKKHQVTTVEALLEIQSHLSSKVILTSELESEIKNLAIRRENVLVKLEDLSNQLLLTRNIAAPKLILEIQGILTQLGMPNAQFKFEIASGNHFYKHGKDEVKLLFSANKGGDFALLKKVASGGELSRIMLAIKAILSQYSQLPTIIFDEIDTGVSGEVAHKMGDIMKKMSHSMQVFAITHLPQIAGKGIKHYKVEKQVIENQTFTNLKVLSQDQRIIEIAQMLSGDTITDSALNHAKSLLN
jgi:DNA repair protein RecN (Recombination protein N)